MTRGAKTPGKRVKTARGRTASQVRWLERQLNDPYVKQAKADGFRSRAAYKLIELDERFGLLKGASRVIDLGIAPGGWAQVVRQKAPKAEVVGIDLLPVEPLEGVAIFQMDFMADDAPAALADALGGLPDLVLSDMAANTVGHKQTDHLRTMGLVEAAAWFATENLAPGGGVRRQGAGRRHRCGPVGPAQTAFRDREARQAAGEPQGLIGMVRDRAGLQGPGLKARAPAGCGYSLAASGSAAASASAPATPSDASPSTGASAAGGVKAGSGRLPPFALR